MREGVFSRKARPKFILSENKARGIEKLGKQEVMEELDRKINLWIRERLIPRLVEGEPDAKFSIVRPTGSFFISDLFFVTVHSAKSGDKSVVVKLPLKNPKVSMVIDYDAPFANEILIYNEIASNYNEDYPKCYLVGKDLTFKSVIVMEDVRPRGYSVSPKKVNLDIDYIVAGLKSIARFHGHSYAVKEKEPARYREIVHALRDDRYEEGRVNEEIKDIINNAAQRLLRELESRYPDSDFTVQISKIFEDAFTNVMMKYAKPAEPLATIVHADCTINNLLYRKKNDGSLEAMLIDFGLAIHSSPTIDVAIFLYMTCKREDIRDRSEELFSIYHNSLAECMKEHGIWNSSKYSREAFWQEYRQRAIFGYVVAMFFRHFTTMYERDNAIPEVTDAEQFLDTPEGYDYLGMLIDMLNDLWVAGMLERLIQD